MYEGDLFTEEKPRKSSTTIAAPHIRVSYHKEDGHARGKSTSAMGTQGYQLDTDSNSYLTQHHSEPNLISFNTDPQNI